MRREALLLREMREAAVSIRELVASGSVDDLSGDAVRRAALLWHFTVLGEAASQMPSGLKEQNPAVAWSAATRLRNRIVHGYWSIDIALLVDTATDDLPLMIEQIDVVLRAIE